MLKRQSQLVAIGFAAAALFAATSFTALAQKKYGPGVTDTEIKIGNITPYSGPASAYGVIGKTEAAYFNKVNAEGGINGRKINFISYDDGYSPPKTVEQARKLVGVDLVEVGGFGLADDAVGELKMNRTSSLSTSFRACSTVFGGL